MGKTSELLSLLKTGNSDAARRLILKLKKSGKKKALAKELNVPDDNGQTVIHFCAAQNFVEFLQDLAELGASIDLADNKGYTPLHLAAASGRTSAVTALINMGADPNISSRTGDTALHLACHGGHVTSVEALVTENANCTMLNVSGHTPIDLACQSGHAQVVSLLLRSGQFSAAYLQRSDMPHTALMLAAKQGHNECIGLLVKHGFDVNRKLPGGNGGTALHEAALSGKVDTVRYLLQCGVDVQKTNAQGHTALDIVNMYTDPRTATIMKQVLQDALAQLARNRITQQHAGQQHAGQQPSTSLRNTSTTMPQPGFSYFPSSGQMMGQQQHKVHGGGAQQNTRHQPQGNMYHQSSHPSHQSVGQPQQPMGQNIVHSHHSQSTGHRSVGQSSGHSHQGMGQSTGHSHQGMGQSSGHSHQGMGQSSGHSHQGMGQSSGHSHQGMGQSSGRSHQGMGQSGGRSHQAMGYSQQYSSSHQQSGHIQQNVSQSHLPTAQNHSQIGQASPPVVHRQNIGAAGVQQHSAIYTPSHEPPPPHNVQHIYPKPGSPEAVRKAPGIGGDLAAIIAAKAANRKPIVTSPTRKHSMELDDERYSRSMTVGGEAGVQQARAAVQRRRSSMSDRSSASPERNDPPTLPRRIQAAGPPAFKPVPPPTDDKGKVERKELEVESLPARRVSSGEGQRKPREQHNPPPSADNELLAKLMRRQNKITELEQATSEQSAQSNEDFRAEPETVQSKPPPPPQRKTPTLNTVQPPSTNQPFVHQPPSTSQPSVHQPPSTSQPSVQQPPSEESTNKQKKVLKPPAPKPKEIESEMTPWQQELAARKARMAEIEPEPELVANNEVKEEKAVSPSHIPKPAPKPKRNKPKPSSTQDQPLPSVPSDIIKQQEPVVIVEESENPVLPVATLVPSNVDQLSRSTSLSSLTTGTGSPQLSHAEHMPIQEWLTSYKLSDYAPVLEGNGYETTELMVGISHEELQEMGINKIGHRKKILSALSNWPQREHFFQVKPESVTMWLSVLHMSQYEDTMTEAGYDDIDFISDVTLDDLHDIGISKRGHVKRLLQGIGELTELVKSLPESAAVEPSSSLLPATTQLTEDTIIRPPANWTSNSSEKVNFGKMKDLLEMKMGMNRTSVTEEDGVTSSSPPSLPPPPIPRRSGEYDIPPQRPPKKVPPAHKENITGNVGSGSAEKSFSVEDITAALGESENENVSESGLDQLDAVLQGLKEETDDEQEPDQLLADIDDMLADLTTHLDFMIPGSTS